MPARRRFRTNRQLFGNDVTPELSGIFSYTNDAGTWGVGLNASYQKRDGGSVQANENDWNIQPWTGLTLPCVPTPSCKRTGHRRAVCHAERSALCILRFQRERINGQAVIQFAPSDA